MSTTDSSVSPSNMDIQQLSINANRWQEEADLLMKCANINRDDSMQIQKEINDSPLSNVIQQILLELYSEREADSLESIERDVEDTSLQNKMEKLDEVLERERITGEELVDCFQEQEEISQTYIQEYLTKLTRIKQVYNCEHVKLKTLCDEYERGILAVFSEQPRCIPISEEITNFILKGSHERTQTIFLQLKMNVIDVVMNVKKKDCRPLKKRRKNFSKQAIEILNEYFYSHLENPYPSDDAKTELATQCSITVGQISNWFGNKRIRYKRNIGKAKGEVMYFEQNYSPGSDFGENEAKQEDLTSSDEDLDEIIGLDNLSAERNI